MSKGQLVPDDIVMRMVAQRLDMPDCKTGCLFDGFPRTPAQAQALDHLLAERNTQLDLVLALDVDEDSLVERLVARGREDDKPEIIRQRFDVYQGQTAPLLDYYRSAGTLHSIDGRGTPEEVKARIKTVVDRSAAQRETT